MSVLDRIRARTVVDENGCHVFTGALNMGYGRVGVGCSVDYTHRLMYVDAKGPIPSGLHIDHLCRNRACCNPEHLEAVTIAENNRRASEANRTPTRGVIRVRTSARNPWRADIWVNGRNVYIGLFPTQEAALSARREAEIRLLGKGADADQRKVIEAEVEALSIADGAS